MNVDRPLGVVRNASAIFAAAVLLAGCGSAGSEPDATAASTTRPATNQAVPTAADDGSDAGGAGGADTTTAPSDASSKASSAPASDDAGDKEKTAQSAPTQIGSFHDDLLSQQLGLDPGASASFPIPASQLSQLVTTALGEVASGNATCDGDLAAVALDPIQCTYTDAKGEEQTAYLYGLKSAAQPELGVLISLGEALPDDLAVTLPEVSTGVYAYGAGSMFAVDQPAPPEDVASNVKSSLNNADHPEITSVTCDDALSITDGANRTSCTLTAEAGYTVDATVIAANILSSGDNGTVTFVNWPGDL